VRFPIITSKHVPQKHPLRAIAPALPTHTPGPPVLFTPLPSIRFSPISAIHSPLYQPSYTTYLEISFSRFRRYKYHNHPPLTRHININYNPHPLTEHLLIPSPPWLLYSPPNPSTTTLLHLATLALGVAPAIGVSLRSHDLSLTLNHHVHLVPKMEMHSVLILPISMSGIFPSHFGITFLLRCSQG
jgi:hypothetical protein